LFKFTGKAGETVTLKLAPEVEEAVVTGEEYALSSAWIESWLEWRGKGRVFLGIRDAIPNVDFRVRKKEQMPFHMSANLPQDGDYYVMVIRPLMRFYKTDYCLTLESDHPNSEAWQTLDVVWPGDDSEEDTATTSTDAKTAELQSAEVYDEGAFDAADTTFGETAEVAPAEEPAAEATDEAAVMGAPSIPEETTFDNTAEVAPDESLDQVSGDSVSTDGSGSAELAEDISDGAESSEGATSDVVTEETTEDSIS
jgi:hypothetical protein